MKIVEWLRNAMSDHIERPSPVAKAEVSKERIVSEAEAARKRAIRAVRHVETLASHRR